MIHKQALSAHFLVAQLACRIGHHDDMNEPPSPDVKEVTGGAVYEGGGVRITAASTDHRPVEPTLGYRIEHDGASVVIGGDGRYYNPEVVQIAIRMAAANEPMPDAPAPMVGAVRLEHVDHEGHGYCTEFLVERRDGAMLDRDLLVRRAASVREDVTETVADNAQLSLGRQELQVRRIVKAGNMSRGVNLLVALTRF